MSTVTNVKNSKFVSDKVTIARISIGNYAQKWNIK